MFQTEVVEKIKTHIFGNRAVYDIIWKKKIVELDTDDNVAHEHFTLDT